MVFPGGLCGERGRRRSGGGLALFDGFQALSYYTRIRSLYVHVRALYVARDPLGAYSNAVLASSRAAFAEAITLGAAFQIYLDEAFQHAYNVDIVADLLGAFEQAVLLAVWTLGEGAYGRAILRGVHIALDRQVSAGAVYATLDRLEQKSLIDSHVADGTEVRAGRARRYYRLTASGIKALNESRAALEKMWRGAKWPLESKA